MSMWFAYVDESGDDGFPGASPLFALSAIYLHYLNWQPIFDQLLNFRRRLKTSHGLPVREEIHTRQLLRFKKPYNQIFSSLPKRQKSQWQDGHHWAKEILDLFAAHIATLNWSAVNVVIVKNNLTAPPYRPVLDYALSFLIQRIENDLAPQNHPANKFIIIADPGREASMRHIARRLRRFNPVPSQYGGTRHLPIRSLIEDPLPKDSKQSYFIQAADFIATVAYLYVQAHYTSIPIPQRIGRTLTSTTATATATASNAITSWMNTLTPILNTHASRKDPYGVVVYP